MAEGHSLYQSTHRQSGLGIGPVISRPALLPFEKQLIKTLGISEDEYRAFVAEVQRRGAVRPAEYALIPDIQAGPTIAALTVPQFIGLNIGLAVVGAGISYLLTPKPKAPKGPDPVTRLELESIRGGNRFVASSGFDTTAELADYGQPIPIIFGMYLEGQTEEQSVGGIMVAPKLVWSRMSSQGRQQTAKLMFVVGEQGRVYTDTQDGIYRPDKEGIFLGNNALDPVQKQNYVFYWKSNSGEESRSGFTRIRVGNAVYGDKSNVGRFGHADPNNGNKAFQDDVFKSPIYNVDVSDKAFSYAYTPANNTEFGLFEPIPNGSAYRVNFEIVPIPGLGGEEKSDEGKRLRLQRIKIAGALRPLTKYREDSEQKEVSMMRGTGRNYSRRMGIISYNGNPIGSNFSFTQEKANVSVGDKIEFKIAKKQILSTAYEGSKGLVTVGDINEEIRSQQIACDDAMQYGELFSIGSTIWQVVGRRLENYLTTGKDEKTQIIELECVDTTFSVSKTIGIVKDSSVITPSVFMSDGDEKGDDVGVRADFYPLTRIAFASFRNNRPAEVVEIGIASTVFQRLNGLCNFQDLISPQELHDYDKDNVAVSSGTVNKYIERTSLFQIYVRLVGEERFELLDILFAVTGNTPVTMYNQIRIKQPRDDNNEPAQYEYKIVPRGSGDLRNVDSNAEIFRLGAGKLTSSKKPLEDGKNIQTSSYGKFKIQAEGSFVTKEQIIHNPEFFQDFVGVDPDLDHLPNSRPNAIDLKEYTLDDPSTDFYATKVVYRSERNFSNLDSAGQRSGRHGAFCYAAFGSADASSKSEGQEKKFRRYENIGNDRWVLLEYVAVKIRVGKDNYVTNNIDPKTGSNVKHAWWIREINVLASSVGFPNGEKSFTVQRGLNATGNDVDYERASSVLDTRPENVNTPYTSSNPFSYNTGNGSFTFTGLRLKAEENAPTSRNQGRFQGFLQEVLGNAQRLSRAVGDTFSSSNLTAIKDGKTIVIKISGRVFKPLATSNVWHGRTKLYDNIQYEVVRSGTDRSVWKIGDTFVIERDIAYDNIFLRHFFRVSPARKIGAKFRVTGIFKGEVAAVEADFTRTFERFSQTNEVSYYGSLVTRSCDDGPEHRITYINEISRNNGAAQYDRLTTAGLVLKANKDFSRLDQLRVWLESGIPVRRLHPTLGDGSNAYGDNKGYEGPSNLFTDLVYHLLTDKTAGVGGTLRMSADNPSLIDVQSLRDTSRFLRTNQLFYNGALSSKVNVREFIASNASAFLCNFIIKDGKFGLAPAVPTTAEGEISTGVVQIKMYFNAGNILEDTFQLEYLTAEERRPFKAVVRYRKEFENRLPEERTVTVSSANHQNDNVPIETFDLTQFCTSHHHAAMAGKYFIGLRLLVSHTVQFSTTASGLNLAPGDYIKVETKASPYDATMTGAVDADGDVVSVTPIPNGTYTVTYYKENANDVATAEMVISDQRVQDSTFYNSLFTIQETTNSANVYIVEQLTFNEDMTVQISASEFKCNDSDQSELAILLESSDNSGFDGGFVVEPKSSPVSVLKRRA